MACLLAPDPLVGRVARQSRLALRRETWWVGGLGFLPPAHATEGCEGRLTFPAVPVRQVKATDGGPRGEARARFGGPQQ
jgi:hypothetical protein